MNTSIKRLAERTTIPVDRGRFIADNYRAVAALIDTPPHTVMHGDAHPGNMYFDGGKAGLSGLAGGPARTPVPRTGLHPDHQPDTRRPPTAQRDLLDDYRQRARRGRRTRPGSRRPVAAVPAGRAVRLCRAADHRRNGRNAGRRHRHGRLAARRRGARRPGNHRGAEEFSVAVGNSTEAPCHSAP